MLILSMIMCISSNSWFLMWMGLEFNLVSFILMLILNKMMEWNVLMKYFLIQSLSSSLFVFLTMFNFILNMNFFSSIFLILINVSLLMKLGIYPFHKWFPNIMNHLVWYNCLILSTFQKLAPLVILSYNFNWMFIMLIILMNYFEGCFMMSNFNSLRIIFSYSSISHSSWLLMGVILNYFLFYLYFMIYFYMMYLYFNFLYFYNLNNLFDLLFLIKEKVLNKFFLMFLFLSFMSFPLFVSFLTKWFLVNFYLKNELNFLIYLMLLMSLISFYIYLRLLMYFMTFTNLVIKFNYFHKSLLIFKVNYMGMMSLIIMFLLGLCLV
uniref:NADH-ubiquinone oxidoreductase chain 2 n=1 Tax=Orthogonalys pulchella TaxID=32427 RepID=A0A096XMY8_9HYME|nr:NADH dehydrogenase subunit 2 [Orthogonalys pulchella]AIC37447.1 NADH dehydrogenase subunit 2 [Orthogonalys pulchella]